MEKQLTMLVLRDGENGLAFKERKGAVIRETEKMVMVDWLDEQGRERGIERKILKRKLDALDDISEGTHYVSMKVYTLNEEKVRLHKEEMLRRLQEHLAETKAKVSAIETLLSEEG